MRSLGYLLLTSLKNTLLELRHKPAKLIMVLALAALICAMPFLGQLQAQNATQHFDLGYLKLAFFLYLMIFVGAALMSGLSSGSTFFEMNDVNLLFVSPISPRKILLYGLVRMFKTAFWAGFFLLFQYGNIARAFAIGYGAILILLAVFMLCMVVCQILSLLIYSLTNGNPRRKRWVRIVACLAYAPLLAQAVICYLQASTPLGALEAFVRAPLLNALPIAGWGAGGAILLIGGQTLTGALLLLLSGVVGALMVVVILRANMDYYEDVLVATETAFEKKRAAQEGNLDATNQRKVKVSGEGLWGAGSSALFGKHLRETLRESRLPFIGLPSVFLIAGSIVMSLLLKGMGLVALLQILMWVQIFLIGTGRGLKETYRHYIYLIPEPPTSKLTWANLELVLRTLIEAVLVFSVAGVVMEAGFSLILLCIACYALFSMLLLAVNFLSMRWTAADLSQGLMIFYYYLAVVLVMLPGLTAALIVGFSVGGNAGVLLGLAILCAWQLIASLLCFFFARGVLGSCDMPTMGAKG